jgi:hypothetical protein
VHTHGVKPNELKTNLPRLRAASYIVFHRLSFLPGSISGTVNEDTNNDNVGDVVLADVVIVLFRTDGSFLTSTLTDSDDNYEFVCPLVSTTPDDWGHPYRTHHRSRSSWTQTQCLMQHGGAVILSSTRLASRRAYAL